MFAIVFGSLPFMFNRPLIGALMFAWLSLMNPHRLTYGAAFDFPFAAIVSVAMLLGLLMSREPKRFPATPVSVTLLVFMAWMTFTSFFAFEPNLVWLEWNRVMKSMLMILVAMVALRTEKEIKLLALVMGVSLGFYGLKGGVFTITSGGASHVFGPDGSYISDNNALALALITILPILWYLHMSARQRWLRLGFFGAAILTVISAAGSYSRGAMLGGGAMLFFLWLKSKTKVRTGLVLLLVAPLLYYVMPEQWFGRMESVNDYQADASALGRINAWHFATNLAIANPLGGGFSTFTHRMFAVYAPNPADHHAAHSIYFQVLGEHGFLGLGLFLLLMWFGWRTGTRIVAFAKGKPELKWASDLAAMCQVSIIGFAVGGAFLTLAYYDLYYYVLVLLVLLEKALLLPGAEPVPAKPGPAVAKRRPA